jgi:UV DNA damage repair endonuclease
MDKEQLTKALNKIQKNVRSMITLEEAKNLKNGTTLYHVQNRNYDGTPQRWRVTSVKTWKRRPFKVEIHLKHGLYDYDKLDEGQLDLVSLIPKW